MRIVEITAGEPILLGREGEHLATQVRFGIAAWLQLYGEGRAELLCQRQEDPDPYPVAVRREGSSIVWDVTSADTTQPGRYGKAELRWYVGETLVKSAISQTVVADALGEPTETPPEPYQSWVDQVLDAAGRAEEAVGHQPIPNADTGTWWTWDAERGEYTDTGEPYSGSGFGGGSSYEIGHGLKVVDGDKLEVDAVSDFSGDNTLPITAAAVQATVGNIEVVLSTI